MRSESNLPCCNVFTITQASQACSSIEWMMWHVHAAFTVTLLSQLTVYPCLQLDTCLLMITLKFGLGTFGMYVSNVQCNPADVHCCHPDTCTGKLTTMFKLVKTCKAFQQRGYSREVQGRPGGVPEPDPSWQWTCRAASCQGHC